MRTKIWWTDYEYYNKLQTVFKEYFGLPSDVDSSRVPFNSVYLWAEQGLFPSSKKDQGGMENCPLQIT